MQQQPFDFKAPVVECSWAVDKLIPLGHFIPVLAQAGVGKSFLLESLLLHSVFGLDFCGLKTIEGDALLIDQDTPTNTLNRRLLKLAQGLGDKPKHQLYVKTMQGYVLSDGSLVKAIKEYPQVKIIGIDCLHSICGKLNPNSTIDMNRLDWIKEECISSESVLIMNHHITEKITYTTAELMEGDPHSLAMGSSAIIQKADTYFILSGEANEGKLRRLYLRPVAKREALISNPIIIGFYQGDKETEYLEYEGLYASDVEEVERDILTLFRESQLERTVEQVYKDMGHLHGEKAVRKGLGQLQRKGYILKSRYAHNLFRYKLPSSRDIAQSELARESEENAQKGSVDELQYGSSTPSQN